MILFSYELFNKTWEKGLSITRAPNISQSQNLFKARRYTITRRTISSIGSSTISFLPLVRVTTVSGVCSICSICSALRINSPRLLCSELNYVSLIIKFPRYCCSNRYNALDHENATSIFFL